ncbi:MAG: acyl-CoA thioesterase [Actinomycetia bacterium]|nr:acyl-CoA thioesterase [Actinomycetes bacterium]
MGSALDELITLLDLEQLEVNLFRGVSPEEDRQRVFGGQVAAQSFIAASRTVPESRPVHSLHGYFLRGGDTAAPIVYEVDRIRDGKSFTTRRVVAIQHGKVIFNLAVSFQVVEDGPDHQDPMPPGVPDPETLPSFEERIAANSDALGPEFTDWLTQERPILSRPVDDPQWLQQREARAPDSDVWIRSNGALPDDPLLHTCIVIYASDLTLLDTASLPHAIRYGDGSFMVASLDHAMWFHRPFRADDWLLYHQHSPSASGARGLAEGQIFTRDGRLAVTVIQEGLMRPIGRR